MDLSPGMKTAVIVSGGDPVPPDVLEDLPDDPWVVAADGGADHAADLGLAVDVLIGDLDSVSRDVVSSIDEERIIGHPTDKDATDLELAFELVAAADDVDRVVLVGGTGGRLDHFLANAMLICAPRFAHLDLVWIAPPARATVVRDHVRLHGSVGDKVSLIPIGGDAVGVTTTGLRWPLAGDDLRIGSTRGVSNEFSTAVSTIAIESGVLLVVQPEG